MSLKTLNINTTSTGSAPDLQAAGISMQSRTNRSQVLAAHTTFALQRKQENIPPLATQRIYSSILPNDAGSTLIAAGCSMKKIRKPVTSISSSAPNNSVSQNQNTDKKGTTRKGTGGIIGVQFKGAYNSKSRFIPWTPTSQQYGIQVEKTHTVSAIFQAVTKSREFLQQAHQFKQQCNSQEPFQFSILRHSTTGQLRIVMQIGQNTKILENGIFGVVFNAIAKEVAISLEGIDSFGKRGNEILAQYVQKTLVIYQTRPKL